MLTVLVMDEPEIIVFPKIPMGLHTDDHTEIHEMTYTLVVYSTNLTLVKKSTYTVYNPQYVRTFVME